METDIKKIGSPRSLNELDELIDLAEEVSRNIEEKTKQNYKNLFIIIFVSAVVFLGFKLSTFFPPQTSGEIHFDKLMDYASIFILAWGFSIYTRKSFKLRKDIQTDKENLSYLLDIIHPYKQLNSKGVGIIKNKIIDMRLNRIKFNVGK